MLRVSSRVGAAVALALALGVPSPVVAQSAERPTEVARTSDCPPYGQHRFVDPTRRYYVVLKDDTSRPWWNQRASFSFARAADGRAFVQRTWVPEEAVEERAIPELLSGDALIAQGFLPDGVGLPGTVLVSSTGWGFVAVAGWCDWHTHSDDVAVTLVEASGEVTAQLRLWQLFDEPELLSLPFVRGPLSWLEGAWMDEDAGVVALVARGADGQIVRFIDRATGELLERDDEIFVAALDHPDPAARATAIGTLAKNRYFVGKLRPRLIEFLHDPDPSVRLSAASVLDEEGDERGFIHLQSIARDPQATLADRRRAVEQLLRRHLEDAIRIVRPLMSSRESGADESLLSSELRASGEWSAFVLSVLEDIGDEAIPPLVELVLDDSLLFEHRRRAIDTMARMASEPALAMLTTLAGYDEPRVSSRALQLLIMRTDDRSIPGRLCDVLMEGRSPSEATIARYFTNRKYAAAIEPLERALRRLDELAERPDVDAERLGKTRTRIESALAFQNAE